MEFLKHENVFLAVGNEKIFNKDFDLEHEGNIFKIFFVFGNEINLIKLTEAFMVFANELMKPIPNFKISKIAHKFLSNLNFINLFHNYLSYKFFLN